MKLSEIILEQRTDLSDLGQIDDILSQAMDDAAKENPTNEAIGTALLILAIPKFLNGLRKIAKGLITKTGFNLSKKDPSTATKVFDFIETVADKIDQYVDYPIDVILKKSVADVDKRKKIKGVIKVGFLVVLALFGGVDLSDSPSLVAKLKSFSSDATIELVSIAKRSDAAKIARTVQDLIKGLT